MSLLYSSPSFKYPEAEFRKNQELMDFSHSHYLQQNQQNSGLEHFHSAPSSFFDNLVAGTNDSGGGGGGGIECEDYGYFRSSSREMDTMLEKFMSPGYVSGDSNLHELRDFGERSAVKQEVADSEMVYPSLSGSNLANKNPMSAGNSLDCTFGVMNSMSIENSNQARKMNPANGSNLARQNSFPPGLFSNLGIVDNGFAGFGVCNGAHGESGPSTSRVSNRVKFSSRPCVLPQIAEDGAESMGISSPDPDVRKRRYMNNFTNCAWDDTSLNGFKRLRENDGHIFTGLNAMDGQIENSRNRGSGLTHRLSLPKTATEMAAIEKYLQFPCKIRAKRGYATHPRSIAERVRRSRISERMKKLQELFPNMDKQTNTADMLDLAVEYIKDLQKQVQTLSDTRDKCMCSTKQTQYSNSTACRFVDVNMQ